jgi:hypothetical protein
MSSRILLPSTPGLGIDVLALMPCDMDGEQLPLRHALLSLDPEDCLTAASRFFRQQRWC